MSVIMLFSLTLLTLGSFHISSCAAFSYTVLSATLPTRSYYLETSLSSSELNPLAAAYGATSPLQISITPTSSDLSFNTTGTGIIAIISKDVNPGSFCVIHIWDMKSSTIQQSGLACTIALTGVSSSARIQAEPSSVTCGGLNPCKSSVVSKLDIDTAANNNNPAQTTTQQTDNMGASSTTIIIASVSGAIGLVVLVTVIVWVVHSRQPSYKHMKDNKSLNTTTSVMWASPPAVLAASSQQPQQVTRGRGDTHVRTQTELNYAVNPMQYNVAVDIHEPALQLAPPTQRYH